MKIKYILYFFCLGIVSCDRQAAADEATCRNIQNMRVTSNSPVTIGDDIQINADEVGGDRIYFWTGPNFFDSQYPENTISGAQLQHEGWYHVSVSNSACGNHADSVYVDVKLKQGTPPCTIANQTLIFSGGETLTAVSKQVNTTWGVKTLTGRAGTAGSQITIYFHPEWLTKEPEDGMYRTINVPSFGQFDRNYNKVCVEIYDGFNVRRSQELKDVYVSHVNGKLRVQFCALPVSSTINASVTMTEM